MGVTIHYTMIADDVRTVVTTLKTVMDEAKRAGYRFEEDKCEGIIRMDILPLIEGREKASAWLRKRWRFYSEQRFDDIPEEPPFAWLSSNGLGIPRFIIKENAKKLGVRGKPTEGEGVIIHYETAESFNMVFWRLGRYYICDEFTKTQPFTVEEVEPNTRYHRWICHILKRLENLPWWNFYVNDEGGYYDTFDDNILYQSFEATSKLIWKITGLLAGEAEDSGLTTTVGGKYDVKRYKGRGQTILEDHDDRQTKLDDFWG